MTLVDAETANDVGKRWSTLQVAGVAQSVNDLGGGLFGFTYNSTDYFLNYRNGADNGSITLSAGTVPEPSTWALLLCGVGALLFSSYRLLSRAGQKGLGRE